jgi:hypothetical protein
VSYREEDGQVILTLSREDYDELLIVFVAATKIILKGPNGNLIYGTYQIVALLDRVNAGNPHYTPYRVEENKP